MPSEAADLAVRITQAWPGRGVDASIWERRLEDLDAGAAGTAFVRLLDTETRPPSIARFVDTYRAIRATQVRVEERERCDRCGGSGWERAADHVRTDAGGNEVDRCSTVAPCRWCGAGKQAGPVHMAVLRANGHLLRDGAS